VEHLHRIAHQRSRVVAGAVAVLGYAVLVALTHPFTWVADVATAVPVAVVAAVTIRSDLRAGRSRGARPEGVDGRRGRRLGRRWRVWMAPILVVTGWELYCLVSLPRVEHPTLSSLIDLLDATRPGKTVAVVAWLGLGWFLVSR